MPTRFTCSEIQIVVINLERSVARRAAMTAQLQALGLPYRFFPAVDGRALSDAQVAACYSTDRAATTGWQSLNRGEIGCGLSHQGIWRELIASGAAGWVVLEDDAVLAPAFAQVLTELPGRVRDGDVVLFVPGPEVPYGLRQVPLPAGHRLAYVNQPQFLATGYYITPLAARRLLAATEPLWCPIDWWYSVPGLKGVTPIRIVLPALVTPLPEVANPSEIGGREAKRARPATRRGWRPPGYEAYRRWRIAFKNRYLRRPVRFD